MKNLILAAALSAALCFGAAEPKVSGKSAASAEALVNDKFRAGAADPYDILGTARCTYLDGYGALVTVELQLIYVSPPSPFRAPYSSAEIQSVRDRKIKKLPQLKDTMRGVLASLAAALDRVPATEKVSIEARLWRFNWEDSRGVPGRVVMTAERGQLLAVQAVHGDIASVIQEEEQ